MNHRLPILTDVAFIADWTERFRRQSWLVAVAIIVLSTVSSAQELLPPVPPTIDIPPIVPGIANEWIPYEDIPDVLQVDTMDLLRRMDEFRMEMDSSTTILDEQLDRLEALLNQPVAPPDDEASRLADTQATETLPTEAPQAPPDVQSEPEPQTETHSIWDDEVVLSTITVTENAINRLALANNLYAAGEIKIALKIYSQLRLESDTKDQAWVIYQVGHCHRRLGNKSESDQAFRFVAALPNGGRWSQYASWWLNNGDNWGRVDAKSKQLADAVSRLRSLVEDGRAQ